MVSDANKIEQDFLISGRESGIQRGFKYFQHLSLEGCQTADRIAALGGLP